LQDIMTEKKWKESYVSFTPNFEESSFLSASKLIFIN